MISRILQYRAAGTELPVLASAALALRPEINGTKSPGFDGSRGADSTSVSVPCFLYRMTRYGLWMVTAASRSDGRKRLTGATRHPRLDDEDRHRTPGVARTRLPPREARMPPTLGTADAAPATLLHWNTPSANGGETCALRTLRG